MKELRRFLADLKRILGPAALMRVVRQLLANDGMAYAGQLAYFFVLFLFPFLIFLTSLAGFVVENPASALKTLLSEAESFVPQEAIDIFIKHLDQALQSTSSLTFFVSGLLTIAAGAASAESIINAANRSYGVEETRPFWKRWAIAVFLIFGFTLLVGTMVFLVLSPQVGDYFQGAFGLPRGLMAFWDVLSWTMVFLNLSLAFAILYYVSPNADIPFRWVTPGGLVITVLSLVSSKIFILWASYIFRSTELYGQLGAGIVLMIWLFITGLVILAGVEINAVLAQMAEERRDAKTVQTPEGGS
jgi:membrane protein